MNLSEDDLRGTQHAGLPAGRFERKVWDRPEGGAVAVAPSGAEQSRPTSGGGGEIQVMRGRVFEKVGVDISTVHGQFPEHFRKEIPGAGETGEFWASGISLVAHMRLPLVPAVHMSTRIFVTSKAWFGGGADLTPMFFDSADAAEDKKLFHAALRAACDKHGADYHEKSSKWCDDISSSNTATSRAASAAFSMIIWKVTGTMICFYAGCRARIS